MIAARAIVDVVARDAFAAHAANWLSTRLRGRDGILAVALSGGETPRPVYELLAAPPFAGALPWPRIHWFFGDERFVPHDHPESNYRMVREALFARAPVPDANIHAIPTEALTPEAAASFYEKELRSFQEMRGQGALFDVTLLGIGPDGHTASLFPGSGALQERMRWVIAVDSPRATRITLTRAVLEQSRALAFLAAGAEKHAVLARLFAGADDLPAAQISPEGELRFILDRAAAP